MRNTTMPKTISLPREFHNAAGDEPITLEVVKIMKDLGVSDRVVQSYGKEVWDAYRTLNAA